jgi:hypothetical protein
MIIVYITTVAAVIAFVLAFFFIKKIVGSMYFLLIVIFCSSIFGILSSLFFAGMYTYAVDTTVGRSAFATQLKQTDDFVDKVESTVSNLTEQIPILFWRRASDTEFYPNSKSNLYGNFVAFLAIMVRIFTFFISFFLLLICTYMKFSFHATFEISKLEKRLNRLEVKASR